MAWVMGHGALRTGPAMPDPFVLIVGLSYLLHDNRGASGVAGSFTGSADRLHPMGPVNPCPESIDGTMRARRAAPPPGRSPDGRSSGNSVVNKGR